MWLFSLFINSVVARLKEAEVGVKCGTKLISMLLYADDAVIFAEDEVDEVGVGCVNGMAQGMVS